MIREKLPNKESGIENDLELPSSLKDKNISLEKLLKEMDQSQQVEELLSRYGLSTQNINEDKLHEVNLTQHQESEVSFQPLSNKVINQKRDKRFKVWVYLGVFLFGGFLILSVLGAYIDFYRYYTHNDADYLELQIEKNQQITKTEPNLG